MGAYTSDGKRRSSMTHATHGHKCEFCERVPFGNGGKISHGRWHVKRGHAVELLKEYGGYPPISSRLFMAADDTEAIARLIGEGFTQVVP